MRLKTLVGSTKSATLAGLALLTFLPLSGLAKDKMASDHTPLILDMVHHNPGEPRYKSRYNDPETIKQMGYNGKVYYLFDSPALAVDWDSVDPDILSEGSDEERWVSERAALIKKEYARCVKAGIKVYAMSDLILFPKRLITKYGMQGTFGDPGDPKTGRYLITLMDLVFEQYPEVEGLVIRIGETYLHDAPYHRGHINDKGNAKTTIIPLVTLLREEICVKHKKKLIFRTWYSFDTDLKTYMSVSDSVEPDANLMFSVKFCEGDFHRANPWSKVLGLGRHKQIVEVQCAREYEGKGAYPNYVAHGVIEGFEEYGRYPADTIKSLRQLSEKCELFAGVWTWTRGGGWGGPYIKNELWCDLNAWVMAQWANDPAQSEESIFKRYAKERLNLKGDSIAKFRKLCLLSADAVIRGRNSTHQDMNPWWTRDAGIGWPDVTSNQSGIDRNLKQKDESVAIWKDIVGLAESIKWPDTETRDFAISSADYGRRLYDIYHALVHLDYAKRRKDVGGMKEWIKAYDDAWVAYNKLFETYPSISTLYSQEYKRHIRNRAHPIVEGLRKQIMAK